MSNARKARSVRQHEPLRVPQNWKTEDRAFVIQLNSQLDDIYAKLGTIQKIAEGIPTADKIMRTGENVQTVEQALVSHESTFETKADRTNLGWGKTFTWTFQGSTSFVSVNAIIFAIVWTPSTGGQITLLVASGDGVYTKTTNDGSISFGSISTDTTYTITRSGMSLTFSTSSNCAFNVIT